VAIIDGRAGCGKVLKDRAFWRQLLLAESCVRDREMEDGVNDRFREMIAATDGDQDGGKECKARFETSGGYSGLALQFCTKAKINLERPYRLPSQPISPAKKSMMPNKIAPQHM
jgi:hypothetical protein